MNKQERRNTIKALLSAAAALEARAKVSAAKEFYADVRDLPPVVQRALRSAGYRGSNIRIVTSETFRRNNTPFEGNRGYNLYVNLATNKYDSEVGSWGGSNMFQERGGDSDQTPRKIPNNVLVIKGEKGGRGSFATIYVNPKTVTPLLPDSGGDDLTDDERSALKIIKSIKGGYRADEFHYKGLGEYASYNPLIQSLREKGLIKINKRGAVMITTKGKNAL